MVQDTKTRFVSPKAWERIEHWSRRKPVFALMGEFSAGKSTLMNFLLRKQALPTQVTATQLPPVWFSYGKSSAYVQRHDGTREDITLDQLETVGVNDAQFIRIYLEADILEAVDLIDTPGISDPKISTDVWRRAVGQANGVLWCTHATQAWRETERATWVSLPERLQHNSLLLVTRADALGQKDRQKVLRRVNREAGHLFNRSILFSARDAIVARDKTGDAELWSRSGGGKMVDSFLEITEQIMDNRADQLARYQIDKSLSGDPKIQPLRPKRKSDETVEAAATPLQLVNPVSEDNTADEVVTSFPVRPVRVERRSDEAERPRIDPDEAERLREEMAPDVAQLQPEETEDDLRSFFRETDSDPLDLVSLSGSVAHVDEFHLLSDEDVDDEDDVSALFDETEETDQPIAEDTQDAEAPETSDDVLANLSEKLADTEDAPQEKDAAPEPEKSEIEVSVSSITALLEKQSEHKAEDYEPEPETSGLVEVQVLPMSPAEPEEKIQGEKPPVELSDILNVPAGSPLSALAMWREISENENLPTDAAGLMEVFQAFLKEFDQIAVEHSSRSPQEALQPVPKTAENNGTEWHVL